jgi:predicted lipid-binding transport protein (Tim44 family)/uncharacterized membrane protein YgcG
MMTIVQRIMVLLIALLCFGVWAPELRARGGGGCVEQGTQVLTPSGPVPIERLKPGDTVLAVERRTLLPVTVRSLMEVRPEEYIELSVNGRILRVTAEHPVETAAGVFCIASRLKQGDRVILHEDGHVANATIAFIRRVQGSTPAYNLLVSPAGTYLANDVVVHNKGCFLPDTPVRTADGTELPISEVRQGDRLLAFTNDGKVVAATVRQVLTHDVEEYRIVRTGSMVLQVTPEHPFYVGEGTFKTLEALQPGDMVYAYDGHRLSSQRIESIEAVHAPVRVHNLMTDSPHTFFANGIAVHNKGGGGGGGGSRGGGGFRSSGGRSSAGGSSRPLTPDEGRIFALVVIGVVVVIIIVVIRKTRSENLDQLFDRNDIEKKSVKTIKLLEFIAQQDPTVSPEVIRKTVESAFRKLQECWQAREYEPMRPLLMPDLYADHLGQIRGMVRNHEINMIEGLTVDAIDLVNVRYTLRKEDREFTALITATATDFYIDDRTSERLRGDQGPAQFQEFWTFQYYHDAWLLREIEQTAESDILNDDNFFEQFTDKGVEQVAGVAAKKEGPEGPLLEGAVMTKERRVERMLNFLVKTDRIWDRKKMMLTSRSMFLSVTGAWEAGDPAAVPTADLFPELARDLHDAIKKNRDKGVTLEFRNLAVRKVELVLVSNFADSSRDEYMARIRAHAQKIMKVAGNVIQKDDDVTAFEQFLTFGRLDGRWKLKEAVLPHEAGDVVEQENVDQEATKQQVEWYYQHKRAV